MINVICLPVCNVVNISHPLSTINLACSRYLNVGKNAKVKKLKFSSMSDFPSVRGNIPGMS